MRFVQCENTGFHLRVALIGPAGSGKSYTALRIATELASGDNKAAILDTENRSARRYARDFRRRFLALELQRFAPADYIQAIKDAAAEGVEVLVIDSLSHAWMGKGGVLDMVDQSAKRQARGSSGSSFNGWREVTPEHNRLVEALIQAPLHLIVTMRVKTEYVVEKDGNGKSVPRKVGLAPVQRDGLEYEFDVVGDMTTEHDLVITKTRCSALADQVVNRPGAELVGVLQDWLAGGVRGPAPEPEPADAAEEPAEQEGAPAPPRAAGPAPPDPLVQLDQIRGWLERIQGARTLEDLDTVRHQLATGLPRRTKIQGDALRRALDTRRQELQTVSPAAQLLETVLPKITGPEGAAHLLDELRDWPKPDEVGPVLDRLAGVLERLAREATTRTRLESLGRVAQRLGEERSGAVLEVIEARLQGDRS